MKNDRRLNTYMGKLKKYLIAIALLFTSLTVDNKAGVIIANSFPHMRPHILPVISHVTVPQIVSDNLKKIKVHLTCYWAHGSGTDSWSERKESSTGTPLKSGVSAAVDPRVIPYYSKIKIPNGPTLIAHDTGTSVINRKASHGKLPIVDVFFNTEREAMLFAENNPEVVVVTIIN